MAKASRGSPEYRAAVAMVDRANKARVAAGLAAWSAEVRRGLVSYYLLGRRDEREARRKTKSEDSGGDD